MQRAPENDGTWDTPRRRLHLWLRLGTPAAGEVPGRVLVQGFVLAQSGDTQQSLDASLLRDGLWHELVVPFVTEASYEIGGFGVGVSADASVADEVPRLDLFLDAVWVE